MSNAPGLPVYPPPEEKKPATIPKGIPNLSHTKVASSLQKVIGKMFKGPQTQRRSIVGKKSSRGRNKKQVNFY